MTRHVIVDAAGGVIRAYASLSVVDDVADLHRIAVSPSGRRRGLASDLLAMVVAEAVARGAVRMLLEVAADNFAAIALYESFGFANLSLRRRYYASGADSLVMQAGIGDTP